MAATERGAMQPMAARSLAVAMGALATRAASIARRSGERMDTCRTYSGDASCYGVMQDWDSNAHLALLCKFNDVPKATRVLVDRLLAEGLQARR